MATSLVLKPKKMIKLVLRLFTFRYLAPSVLASVGAVGYVGYAFAQAKPIPSSPNVSFLHLLGVAGKSFFY